MNTQRIYFKDLVMTPRSADLFREDYDKLKASHDSLVTSIRDLIAIAEAHALDCHRDSLVHAAAHADGVIASARIAISESPIQ